MPTPRKYEKVMSAAVLLRLTPDQKALILEVAEQADIAPVDLIRDWAVKAAQTVQTTGIPVKDAVKTPEEVTEKPA